MAEWLRIARCVFQYTEHVYISNAVQKDATEIPLIPSAVLQND